MENFSRENYKHSLLQIIEEFKRKYIWEQILAITIFESTFTCKFFIEAIQINVYIIHLWITKLYM